MDNTVKRLTMNEYDEVKELATYLHNFHYQARPDLFKPKPAFNLEYYSRLISDDMSLALGIFVENKLVGYLFAHYHSVKEHIVYQDCNIMSISDIVIHPDYQHNGLATNLLEAFRIYCSSYDVDSYELNVYAFNEAAIKLYEKFGFKPKNIAMEYKI